MVMKAHAINLRSLPNPKAAVHLSPAGNTAGEKPVTAKLDPTRERSPERIPAGDEKGVTWISDRLICNLYSKFTRLEGPKFEKGITDALRMLGEFVRADRSFLCFLAGKNRKITDIYEWCRPGIEPKRSSWEGNSPNALPWKSNIFRKEKIPSSPPEGLEPGKTLVSFLWIDRGARGSAKKMRSFWKLRQPKCRLESMPSSLFFPLRIRHLWESPRNEIPSFAKLRRCVGSRRSSTRLPTRMYPS
jgi:hypothetical protein